MCESCMARTFDIKKTSDQRRPYWLCQSVFAAGICGLYCTVCVSQAISLWSMERRFGGWQHALFSAGTATSGEDDIGSRLKKHAACTCNLGTHLSSLIHCYMQRYTLTRNDHIYIFTSVCSGLYCTGLYCKLCGHIGSVRRQVFVRCPYQQSYCWMFHYLHYCHSHYRQFVIVVVSSTL